MRILVTGSRDWRRSDVIGQALSDQLTPEPEPDQFGPWVNWSRYTVVHGGARGADSIANRIAGAWRMNVEAHPADWATHGRAAGPIRNAEMVALGADVCITFASTPTSRGTFDCARRARAVGIRVVDYGCSTTPPHQPPDPTGKQART